MVFSEEIQVIEERLSFPSKRELAIGFITQVTRGK
jgi:hypothetical protein